MSASNLLREPSVTRTPPTTGFESRLLFPLDEFYRTEGLLVPSVTEVRGDQVPEPYHHLLVHNRDMTPTLEVFHGERIHLRVLRRRLEDDRLWREVVLTLDTSGRPVEFGAIVIHCDCFPSLAREEILLGHSPLGTILADHAIQHTSSPHAFLRVHADALIADALRTNADQPLWARRNVLSGTKGEILADILEILPPADGGSAAVMQRAGFR